MMGRGPAAVRDRLFCYCCSRRSGKQICCQHSITSSFSPSRNCGFPLRSLKEQDLRRRSSVSLGWIWSPALTRNCSTGKAAPHLQAPLGVRGSHKVPLLQGEVCLQTTQTRALQCLTCALFCFHFPPPYPIMLSWRSL